jgi:hypothetical protein
VALELGAAVVARAATPPAHYAIRAGTASEPAACGADAGLSIKAGGRKNATDPMLRAFTIEAPASGARDFQTGS